MDIVKSKIAEIMRNPNALAGILINALTNVGEDDIKKIAEMVYIACSRSTDACMKIHAIGETIARVSELVIRGANRNEQQQQQ